MHISLRRYVALLATYLRPQRAQVALLAALLLGGIALELLSPQIVRVFIDTATSGGTLDALLRAATLFVGVALLTQLMAVGATYLSQHVGWTATNALRVDVAEQVLNLDLRFHKARTPGELIQQVDGDVTTLSNFFSQFMLRVLGNALLLVGVLLLLAREHVWVGVALGLSASALRSRPAARSTSCWSAPTSCGGCGTGDRRSVEALCWPRRSL